jgi:hypothetical protein
LPHGVTPGWFDLRGIVDPLPWPEVRAAGFDRVERGTITTRSDFDLSAGTGEHIQEKRANAWC